LANFKHHQTMILTQPLELFAFEGKLSWKVLEHHNNNFSYQTEFLSLLEIQSYAFLSKILNKPYRIVLRNTRNYMKEPFAAKYVLAEDSNLEQILQDWDYLHTKLIPKLESLVQKKELISFEDIVLTITGGGTVDNAGLFNPSLLKKYDNSHIGLLFYHFDEIVSIPEVLKEKYTLKLIFPSGIVCNTCKISVFPINIDLKTFSKLKQEELKGTVENLYMYEYSYSNYKSLFIGYQRENLRTFNICVIFDEHIYIIEYFALSKLFNVTHVSEIVASMNFYPLKKRLYKFGKISFLYSPNFHIKSNEVIGGNEILILNEKYEKIIFLIEKSSEDENLSDGDEELISENITKIFNVESKYFEFKKDGVEFSRYKFKMNEIEYQFTFNNSTYKEEFLEIVKTMNFENSEKENILNIIFDCIQDLEIGSEPEKFKYLHPSDVNDLLVCQNLKSNDKISELMYHLKLELDYFSSVVNFKVLKETTKIYGETMTLHGSVLSFRTKSLEEKQWYLCLSRVK
jgi:hypothetical protein